MRLWAYFRFLLVLTIPVALGGAAIMVTASLNAGSKLTLPGWGIIPFMAGVLFPLGLSLILRFKKAKFTVPVPDPDEPAFSRASRKIALVAMSFLLFGVGTLAWFFWWHATRYKGDAHAAVFLVPAVCLFFSTLPWFRLWRFMLKAEADLIEKYSGDEEETE